MPFVRSIAPARFLIAAHTASCIILLCVLLPWTTTASAQTMLRGRVVDATGAPMARASVTLVSAESVVVTTTLTDMRGMFAFARTCEKCRVQVTLAGFTTTIAAVTPETEVRVTMAVAPVGEAVVVTATRSDAPMGQLAASVTVFDREAITRRGDALVGDLLRQAPGVAVVQNGGQGNVTSLFVRGGENNYTKVLLDGIALNEPGGAFNFGGLTTGHLDRVEFVRGAQSALFGSDAMAGVLQLVSHRGQPGARPSLSGELGTGGYGTMRGSATLAGGTSRWDYSLYGGHYETDNRAPNNHFDSTTVSLTAGGALNDHTTVRVVGRLEDGRVGTPGQTAFGRADQDAFFTQSHLTGGVTLEQRVTPTFTQRLTYALATSEQRSTNLLFDAPYTPAYEGRVAPFEFYDFTYDSASAFKRHQAGYQGDLRLTHGGALAGAEFFTVAFDWEGERATLTDYLSGESTTPSRNNFGATAQHQHINRWFALTTGVRAEHNQHFGTVVVPRASVAVFLRSRGGVFGATKLKGNAGSGIKEPTMRQSFSLSPFDMGNPKLEAERSRSFDAGIEQRLFDDRMKLDAVWFDNRFEHQISTRTISYSPYLAQYFNVGQTRANGTELMVEAAPVKGLRLLASHTFTRSRIVDATSEFSEVLAAGQWALRRPRHAAQVQAFWDRGRVSFDMNGSYVGTRSDSDFSSLVPALSSSGGYWLWRAQAVGRVTNTATAYVRIENLTDRNYMEPLGYPAWRRTVQVGLRIKVGGL